MDLIFVTEARFLKGSTGNYFNTSFNNALWKRYLEVFTEIKVVARVHKNEKYDGDTGCLSSMERVSFIELPYYEGPEQYLSKRKKLKKEIKRLVREFKEDKFICRIPGVIGNLVISQLNKLGKSYAVEVVGDPWDVFASGANPHPLRSFFRLKSTVELRIAVNYATAALYVTQRTLQKSYPARNAKFIIYASNVNLKNTDFVVESKILNKVNNFNIICVGTLDQMYKFPHIVLKAIKHLHDQGIKCNLIWVGGGIFLDPMKALAEELHISHLVHFKGSINSNEVKSNLLISDLFVLASRQEGLPRAMIEAMATGLPCIGTKVGGIPELLGEAVLVSPGNVEQLASKMKAILLDPDFYNRQAARNLEEAKNYSEAILSGRRNQFYKYIVDHL